jgi:HK97 family phage major capsid protein
MGYPIFFVENAQPLGTQGDLILADLSKYVVGDRQMVTIDSSKHFRFQYDLTSWRAVHRVDGRPWLSAPITYRDGVTTVSPFVILDGAGAS